MKGAFLFALGCLVAAGCRRVGPLPSDEEEPGRGTAGQDSGPDGDAGGAADAGGTWSRDTGTGATETGGSAADTGGAACVIRVDGQGGDDDRDGSSWELAVATVQEGIDRGAERDGCEVWVAAGTYLETITLRDHVSLFGGFTGDEGVREARDPAANATVLDGGGSGPVVTCTADACGDHALIDGFTITNGDNPEYGGGMFNEDTSPTVSSCIFLENSTAHNGGGMYNYRASPAVIGCLFEGNIANWNGGGISNYDGSPTISDCTFTRNEALIGGGGMYNSEASPAVAGCAFSENVTVRDGGGMFNINESSATVTACLFAGNRADGGGGMANAISSPVVTHCTFAGNAATNNGGGMSNRAATPSVSYCIFAGNAAGAGGGGMENWTDDELELRGNVAVTGSIFTGNAAARDGGGMLNNTNPPDVVQCTFFRNVARAGGGMFNVGRDDHRATVFGTIFWTNSASEGNHQIHNYDAASSPVLTYSDVEGGCDTSGDIPCTIDATGNIDGDPLFVDGDSSDGVVDLRLICPAPDTCSPCVDRVPATALPPELTEDLDGNARMVDIDGIGNQEYDVVDMGAYELAPLLL